MFIDYAEVKLIGGIGGLVTFVFDKVLLNVFKLDDVVGAVAVHGFSGAWYPASSDRKNRTVIFRKR